MHKGITVTTKDHYKIVDCEECGFKHLDPIPSKEEISAYYRNKYYQETAPGLLDPKKEEREITWASLAFKDMSLIFDHYVKEKSMRLLDVGCGNGFFLQFMKRQGWEVQGIEPSLQASKHALSLGLDVFQGSLEEFFDEKWQHYFDAINFKEIMEHVSHPIEVLGLCKRLLKENGVICIEVPNDFNSLQRHLQSQGQKPWWIVIPEHINYFNFESLERLLITQGFEILFKTTGFPMELFIFMGESYIDDKEVGQLCHQRRMNMELNLPDELRRNIYRSLAELGIGRSCILYAQLKGDS